MDPGHLPSPSRSGGVAIATWFSCGLALVACLLASQLVAMPAFGCATTGPQQRPLSRLPLP